MNEIIQNNYVQIVLRCIAVYVFMIIAIRIFGKKELAQLSVIDLVFILLISNSVQNAMVGADSSLKGGIVAAISLFAVNFTLKKILFKSKIMSELLQGKNLLLIYKGQLNQNSLDEAEITLEELEAAVREHGVMDIQHVDLAMLEVDGSISVISDDFQKKSVQVLPVVAGRRKHKLKGRISKS